MPSRRLFIDTGRHNVDTVQIHNKMTHLLRTIEIELSDLTIHGLTYVEETSQTTNVLCLHGWLDNANSFRPLLPLMPELNAVAIDLPGHGRSGHLNQAVPYTIASSAHYVLQTAEACLLYTSPSPRDS